MRKTLFTLFTGLALLSASAADDGWLTDFAKAQAKAKAEKKLVLLDFTGSDWCPPCKALHKNVLTSAEFEKYAKENLVLVEVDFPQHKSQPDALKKANAELAKKYGIEGYPTIIVLNAEGKQVFKEVGYGGTDAKTYLAKLEKEVKKK